MTEVFPPPPTDAQLAAHPSTFTAVWFRTGRIDDLDVPTPVLEAQLAEQRHQFYDLDADSSCRLPGCINPACPPKGTQPPGGSDG